MPVNTFHLRSHGNQVYFQFFNKVTKQNNSIPFEFFYTLDEPARFKGKLTDQQLDVFVKVGSIYLKCIRNIISYLIVSPVVVTDNQIINPTGNN